MLEIYKYEGNNGQKATIKVSSYSTVLEVRDENNNLTVNDPFKSKRTAENFLKKTGEWTLICEEK